MANDIYQIFNNFLKKTIIEKKFFFSTESQTENVFTNDSLAELVERYVIDYIGSPENDENAKKLLQKLKEKHPEKKDKIELNFENKVKEQLFNTEKNVFGVEGTVSEKAESVFGHLMWLQYLPAIKPLKSEIYGEDKCRKIKDITRLTVKYETNGCAGYGMAAMRLDEDLTDLVLLFNELVQDNLQKQDLKQIKDYIINWCLDLEDIRSMTYISKTNGRKCPEELLPIHNMLLHLCEPQKYAPIAVSGHKKKIVETFGARMEEGTELSQSKEVEIKDDANEYNKKLYNILKKVEDNNPNQLVVKKIYTEYKDLWNVGSDNNYSDVNALKFKKAIILYGPPGTSKTYSAEGLAKNLIFQLEYKNNVTGFIEKERVDHFKSQIHCRQLHPNYTYEDFIWGYQIADTKTIAKKGYFLRLLDDIAKDNMHMHILILDEINRVDLSRLFGELFSAIENRNKPIDLPVEVEGATQISLPSNLYIIGTMNEIDFSLERVDFALRRRFSWFLYSYNEDRLKDILDFKISKNKSLSKFDDNMQQKYVKCCSALNKMIDIDQDLGPKYEIGHTFFAELVDIWEDLPQKGIKSIQEILWNISIGPMIEAYLGNCDEESKKNIVKNYKAAFIIEK